MKLLPPISKRSIFYFTLLLSCFFGQGQYVFSIEPEFKILYLVRHAKSSDADPTLQDFDRPLNERGFADAPEMGKRLKKLGILPDLIVSSPSKRTTQTIELLSAELGYKFEEIQWDSTIYRCSQEALLKAIKNTPNHIASAMFVGHNPSMTQIANLFQTDSVFQEVPTCGVVAIRFETNSWQNISKENAKLIFFERPRRN